MDNPAQEEYGQERLLHTVRRHAHLPTEPLLDAILEDVEHYSGTKEFEDDVCLVGVEVERVGLPV